MYHCHTVCNLEVELLWLTPIAIGAGCCQVSAAKTKAKPVSNDWVEGQAGCQRQTYRISKLEYCSTDFVMKDFIT
jgi:hypothetical protein